MLVTTQGAVRVNSATVERDYGDCLLVHVDLHSKYAELSAILTGDEEGPSVFLSAGAETLHLDDTQPRGQDTTIEFHNHEGWRVFASSGPWRYTLALVLVAPDAQLPDGPAPQASGPSAVRLPKPRPNVRSPLPVVHAEKQVQVTMARDPRKL